MEAQIKRTKVCFLKSGLIDCVLCISLHALSALIPPRPSRPPAWRLFTEPKVVLVFLKTLTRVLAPRAHTRN